jgi:hypothetical protein
MIDCNDLVVPKADRAEALTIQFIPEQVPSSQDESLQRVGQHRPEGSQGVIFWVSRRNWAKSVTLGIYGGT